MNISLQQIFQAKKRILPHIIKTPLVHSNYLSNKFSVPIHLKLESFQKTGSFKFRGATNAILSLNDRQKEKGVVCVSTGNHGKALAKAAIDNNIKPFICVSKLVPENKIVALKESGAELIIDGASQDDAQKNVDRLVLDGLTQIAPFDDLNIIAGQGTMALEILEELPNIKTILVPISGGGLICGLVIAMKSINKDIKVIGVSMKNGACMYESIKAGKICEVKEYPSLADSLGGGIGINNKYTFNIVKKYVDEIITVTEIEIYNAIAELYNRDGIVCEGASAVCLSALNSGLKVKGPIAMIISGKNIDMELHKDIITKKAIKIGNKIIK